jgi:hypothetical protein
MHPLYDNMKSFTYEELEKKLGEINKRIQMFQRSANHNPLIWDQLIAMRDSIQEEKIERARVLIDQSVQKSTGSIVLNTDPLPDDESPVTEPVKSRTFNPIT